MSFDVTFVGGVGGIPGEGRKGAGGGKGGHPGGYAGGYAGGHGRNQGPGLSVSCVAGSMMLSTSPQLPRMRPSGMKKSASAFTHEQPRRGEWVAVSGEWVAVSGEWVAVSG